jgi:chemotaxis methyl-accepting protein methylase
VPARGADSFKVIPSAPLSAARRRSAAHPPIAPGDLDALARAAAIRLSSYRSDHVADRVARSLARESVDSPAELAALLARCPEARSRFRRDIAISVTGRFRDPEQFDLLRQRILPDLLGTDAGLRVWSAGCSTGLELYGVADLLGPLRALGRARMLGSDLLDENIDVARSGGGDGVAPSGAVTAALRWEVRDLLDGAETAGKFRLVLCRNVGIYFTPEARHSLMTTVAGAVAPGGVLMLGRSERLPDPAAYGLERYLQHAYRRPLCSAR